MVLPEAIAVDPGITRVASTEHMLRACRAACALSNACWPFSQRDTIFKISPVLIGVAALAFRLISDLLMKFRYATSAPRYVACVRLRNSKPISSLLLSI